VEVRWTITGTKHFGFVRRSEDAVRAFIDMDYVASDELGNFVRLGFVLDVQFTFDEVQDSWAMVVSGDGLAGANLGDNCL